MTKAHHEPPLQLNQNFRDAIEHVLWAAQRLYDGGHAEDADNPPKPTFGEGASRYDWTATLEIAARMWGLSRATQKQILEAERAAVATINEVLTNGRAEAVESREQQRDSVRRAELARLDAEDDAELAKWSEQEPAPTAAKQPAGA